MRDTYSWRTASELSSSSIGATTDESDAGALPISLDRSRLLRSYLRERFLARADEVTMEAMRTRGSSASKSGTATNLHGNRR